MKLSTKSRHAITAMMELALHKKQGPVTLADISMEQAISVSYLEQLFAHLRKSQLVTGLRGPGGGYRLSKPAHEITIAEIIDAVSGLSKHSPQYTAIAVDGDPINRLLWKQLSGRIYHFLDGITLADAIQEEDDIVSDAHIVTNTPISPYSARM
ncbi:MAG: Rrf2 family transcriptional regulator [Gammaproteobacteria bacterium]|nr:Rrf2 family transcriptional regulator [Gammaproteobacteria bacterium]